MSKDITPDGSFCPVFLEPADLIQVAADKAEQAERQAAMNARAAAKKSAQTKLAALGLTADEIAAL